MSPYLYSSKYSFKNKCVELRDHLGAAWVSYALRVGREDRILQYFPALGLGQLLGKCLIERHVPEQIEGGHWLFERRASLRLTPTLQLSLKFPLES